MYNKKKFNFFLEIQYCCSTVTHILLSAVNYDQKLIEKQAVKSLDF